MYRCHRKRKNAEEQAAAKKGVTPNAMTPSAAFPYYDAKPMQFRGVKIRAEPPVRHEFSHLHVN